MASRSALLTVLFTDIVGSTDIADELGNARWRELLTRHHRIIRRELQRFGGREIDTAGDGFFAVFDRPTQAVRCAAAAFDGVRELGIELRAGVHVGEIERTREGVSGVAVHLGARIGAAAGPGEVLVSDTVRQLTRGSGIVLADRGIHALKGVPESQALFSVSEIDGKRLSPPLADEEARARRDATTVLPPPLRRRRVAVVAAVTLVVAVLTTVAVLMATGDDADPPPPTATDPAGSVVRIDPETNTIAQRIRGLASINRAFSPPQVEVGEGGVWVLDGDLDVRRVDPSSGDVTPVELSSGASTIALGHGRLWITQGIGAFASTRLFAVSPGTQRIADEIELEVPSGGHRTFVVAVTEDWVWAMSQGVVTRVDPTRLEHRVVATGLPEDGMLGARDVIWFVDRLGNSVSRFDPATNRVIATVPLQSSPDELAAAEDGTLWVLDEFQRSVTPLSPDGDVGRAIPIGEDPLAVAAGDGAVWVGGRDDKIRRIDPALDRVVATIDVGADVQAIDVDPDTGEVWAYLATGPLT